MTDHAPPGPPRREPPRDLSSALELGLFAAALLVAVVAIVAGRFLLVTSRNATAPPLDASRSGVTELSAGALQWSCRTLDGEEVALADLRDQTVFFNAWATWCPPCVGEMPDIAALARSVRDRGVRFLLVSQESPETVRAFARAHELDLPFATAGRLPEDLQTASIPATFVLRGGRIVYRHIGAADWNEPRFREWLLALE